MKKENIQISSIAFMSFSLGAFVLVSSMYLFLSAKVHYTYADKKVYGIEEVYLNDKYNANDQYATKIGGLKGRINGPIISNFDPYLGNFDAPIKIIVYSDFTCSYCRKQEAVIKKVLKKYDGKVRFIWKDYPESNFNSISFKSALAARCAQNQDKFWEFHDLLFSSTSLSEDSFYQDAKKIGLNTRSFEACYSKELSKPLVLSNIKEADAIGVIGVPDVYINDKEFIGNVSEKDFSLAIEYLLKND